MDKTQLTILKQKHLDVWYVFPTRQVASIDNSDNVDLIFLPIIVEYRYRSFSIFRLILVILKDKTQLSIFLIYKPTTRMIYVFFQ